ncbi:MAG: FUSC family protein, partial [Butyricicoccus sp.]
YGLKSAVGLRVAQNVFGVVFALLFCLILQRIFARWERSAS